MWLRASLVDSRDRLLPLFADVRRIAGEQPQLAETVLAFADAGLSLAHAADALRIHPNTVAYRLGQWHRLTGTDPRTFTGLLRSVVGITG
ncbi:helix-turn-helix domain-containing protein [Streptomyces sp. NPDC101776]|uniref:helix-turn-helix domain-containing protein n=1 Tax=Streptomyces sp. NPDC101776 TaxID=3366146 RepID=UPI0038251CE3